ncbi:MAG: deoxyribonuclease IV [bacterium]|nr:deoxyribonuclease IV [bacterium]
MSHRLGAHLSIAGGMSKALERASVIGANCLQIFSTSPRRWLLPKIAPPEAETFIKRKRELGIDPVYFHSTYLINLAQVGLVGERSVESLVAELKLADTIGIRGSIVHLGSLKNNNAEGDDYSAHGALISHLKAILGQTPESTLLMIENAGTRKIGKRIEEIAWIIKAVNNRRLRVCLDTCHLHAAGYDITSEKKLEGFLSLFDSLIGLPKLELIHTNDSKDSFGSLRDRHENIGKGKIGLTTFKLLLNHKKLRALPFIIETPGFDDKGPDKKNLDILRTLID